MLSTTTFKVLDRSDKIAAGSRAVPVPRLHIGRGAIMVIIAQIGSRSLGTNVVIIFSQLRLNFRLLCKVMLGRKDKCTRYTPLKRSSVMLQIEKPRSKLLLNHSA